MSIMYAQMASSVASSAFGFASARSNAKHQQAMQGYRNAMLNFQAAQASNVTTRNEIAAQEQSQRQSVELQRQAMLAQGQADVAAGAAGMNGNSTAAVATSLSQSLARANFARTEQLRNQYIAYGQERSNIEMQRVTGQSVEVIPTPSTAAAVVGFGTTLLKTYDQYQPEGDRMSALFVDKNRRLYT